MDEFDTFDPGLFGLWSQTPVYGEGLRMDDAALAGEARRVLLEIKSAEASIDPAEELRRLLNEMTVEMREQFSTFRNLRTAAEKALVDGDDAAQKLARADVKAATDAMSLIVRTLEKVDALQRQLAHDREIAAEQAEDEGGYEEAKARFMKLIEERAHDTAIHLYQAWKRDGPPPDIAAKLEHRASQSAHPAPGDGETCGQNGVRDGGAWADHGPDHGGV